MRLAIVHYHLRKGGVTRVIASALEALGDAVEEVVVLSSTLPEEPLPCPIGIIPELAYASEASERDARVLHEALVRTATRHLGQPPDIWHIHNHCLGKNVNFPEVLRRLLDDGQRTLLQVHDFSEDGRPENYAAQRRPYSRGIFDAFEKSLFPVAAQLGYAVLNGRDRDILIRAGVPESRVFWLPNSVTRVPAEGSRTTPVPWGSRDPFYLYPTRAIRRKNLGELLLLASSLDAGSVATTLTPKNPNWIPIHDAWRSLAGELRLPVHFGVGEMAGNSFSNLIASSTALLTTSVGEGFGLAFLEPWLMGKPLVGRDLPEVTSDFRDNGIDMPGLYPKWPVPANLLDRKGLKKRYKKVLQSVYAAYQQDLSGSLVESSFEKHVAHNSVDFGFLDETAQAEVLRNLHSQKIRLPLPVSLNMALQADIPENANRIDKLYGLDHYKSELLSIYNTLLTADPSPVTAADPKTILAAFLDPARFTFLRT